MNGIRKFFLKSVQLVQFFLPPGNWRVPVIVMSGFFTGLFSFLFYVSKAPSYLSDEPATCVNCHIMVPQYATWYHSSHRERATCNDCHVPQDNFFRHYFFKAKDGLRHSAMFTFRLEPQVIFIHQAGRDVVQENCIRCHGDMLFNDKTDRYTSQYHQHRQDRTCTECHRDVPHTRINGLSSVPDAKGVPLPGSAVPQWLTKIIK